MIQKKMKESELYPLLALVVTCGVWFLTRTLLSSAGRKTKKLPPSPPKLPILGNLHQVGKLLHRSLASLSKKYGPLMSLQLGNKTVVVISSAAGAKEAVKNHDILFSCRPVLTAIKQLFYGGKGLIFSSYGDQWRMLRSIFVNHLLHKRIIKSYKSIRDEETSTLMENIDKLTSSASAPVNLTMMFSSMANDMICKSAFGKKYRKGEEGNKIMRLIEEVVKLIFTFTVGEFIPWLAWTNRWNGFDAALDKISKSKDELLDARIQEYVDNASSSVSCFADILVGLYKGNTPGVSIDNDLLKAIVQDVLGSGTETTAAALEWAMTELITHPEMMKKLQDEVREVMNGKQDITEEELEKMQYLKAVVKETLRLHPSVPVNLRETNEDVQLMGYDIPSGTMVIFNMWAICRDPDCWEQPENFLPDRFLNSPIDYNGLEFHFSPFGFGRRICPGMSFAVASIEHVLANLMHKFDWHCPDGARGEKMDVTEKPGLVVARKTPLIVVPTKCCY